VIDFAKTKVCFPKGRTMTAIYINDGRKYKNGLAMTDQEYLALRNEVIAKLKELKGPDGTPVTPQVYTKDESEGNDGAVRCPE
jgi:predicted AlkP superfamily phosphohydrolase/phosphomutase